MRRRASSPSGSGRGKSTWSAAAHAREYYAEHGEWERETIARQQAREQRAEDARLKKEQAEAAQWRQAQVAQLVASGRRYRTVSEVLAEAALYP